MSRKVVASTYLTLDGFMDEPGRWSFPFWSGDAARFKADELAAADALLLGRITYEGFASAWPTMEGLDEFGQKMNRMPKHVASRTLTSTTWNASIIQGDVAEAVRALKAEDGGDLLIGGSGQLVDFLTWHDLIDEYKLMIHPIVLGTGSKRLFTTVTDRTFDLVDSKVLPKGIVVQTYRLVPNA